MTADDVQASLGRVLALLGKPVGPEDPLEIPAYLRVSQEERAAAWERHEKHRLYILHEGPPKEVLPEVQAELDAQAERKRIKAGTRIGEMKAKLADRAAVKAGKRWDARNGRWIED
jgi:hypothetical protein